MAGRLGRDEDRRELEGHILRERLQVVIGELREGTKRQQRLLDEIDDIIDSLLPLSGAQERR
jgi:hypothetical protein